MSFKKWLSDNVLWVLIALIAANVVIVYWATVNLGMYGAHSSVLGWDMFRRKKTPAQGQTQTPPAVSSPNLVLVCSDDDMAAAFAAVRSAVVNITADKVSTRKGGSLAAGVTFDDPAIRFVQEQSLGSGIIVDGRGYILTNAHVASKAQDIKVVTFGFERREYTAQVVRTDPANDIAILKINTGAPLPVAVLGDSEMIKVAQTVMAVGSPFGLEQTVTAGIISDNSRDLVIDGQTYEDMIQTDATINRGNSGGPLINTAGEVIGINTAIYAPTGVFTGVGFAIPINKAKPFVRETLAGKSL